jgi:RHS repeat-associated protein
MVMLSFVVKKSKKLGKLLQHGVLFFLSLALLFGLVEPGASIALAQTSTDKNFDTNYKLAPLSSESISSSSSLTEANGNITKTIKDPKGHKSEDISKRTPFTSTYTNNDGSRTMKYSVHQQNYKDGNSWKKIDNSLSSASIMTPSANFLQVDTATQSKAEDPVEFKGTAGTTVAKMDRLSRGLTIQLDGKTVVMKPVGARDVIPLKESNNSVIYKDAWPDVDLEYELKGETVKEIIIVKSKKAQTVFNFSVTGGKVVKHPNRAGELTIDGLSNDYSFSPLSLSLDDRGVITEERVTQAPSANGITVSMDDAWMKKQPDSSFPMRIDPSVGKDSTSYWMFKSDGYSCGTNCYANIGAINDNGWKNWRSYVQFPISDLAGKTILNATLHGYYKSGIGGDTGGRWIWMGHANCVAYNCQGSQVGASGNQSTDFDIDFTAGLQQSVNNSDWGTVWSLWGEEGAYKTYKPYWDIVGYITYDTPTPAAPQIAPSNGQVVVDAQPTLKVGAVVDPDGPVQYQFNISTNADASTGAVTNSDWTSSPNWTVPEGVLQDGTTYYWKVQTRDAGMQPTSGAIQSFKVNLRTGKNSTQSYDTVGPVGIDLATGNASISATTNTIETLGGSIGLNLTYTTPNSAKKGLKAEFWNTSSSNPTPSGPAQVTRRDQNIDFRWGGSSPTAGINSTWFYGRWSGQFVAPVTGDYQFGASSDDDGYVSVAGTVAYNQACYTGVCYGKDGSNQDIKVSLNAGQAVPIEVKYLQATGGSYLQLYTKGPVPEQVVPRDWLYTEVTNSPKGYGLTGRYYTDNGDHSVDNASLDASRTMMVRQDTSLNINFSTNGPAQGLSPNFLARWTGYVTVPTNGSYKLGMIGDDGARIRVNTGSWNTVLDSWAYTNMSDRWGSSVNLTAGTQIPIIIDYNQIGGPGSFTLRVQDTTGAQYNMPVTWLTPDANAVPNQWKLGVDVNGNVGYERMRVASNSVILEDSTGSTHEYTYTNGGYKAPANEDGTLSKNSDNTYTFMDTDGRTYIFDATGKLVSLTKPSDDRQPAALKYTYSGDPSRLIRVEDGTTNARFATVYYKGINDTNNICDKNGTNNPSSFFGLISSFSDAPNGKLCAFATSDGSVTNFYYDESGNLARVVQPGGQVIDYAYDTIGRITDLRDSLAADAVSSGVRTADSTVLTTLSYDTLGRISSVKTPAASVGAGRVEHTFGYKLSDQLPFNRFISPTTGDHRAFSLPDLGGYRLEFTHGYIFKDNGTGLVPLYSCMVGGNDEMVSWNPTCEGQSTLGRLGYVYNPALSQPAGTVPVYRCLIGTDHFTSTTTNCEGQVVEFLLGYASQQLSYLGATEMHIVGTNESTTGYSKRIEYDNLLRATKETDLTGKSAMTEWDPVKDLILSKTNAQGLKSTTIYDQMDRPTDTYGPAPSSWFGIDRKPTSTYLNQTPHASTAYDEGIAGFAVSVFNNTKLLGTPKFYTTSFNQSVDPSYVLNLNNTTVIPTDGLSMRATGKVKLDQASNYVFKLYESAGSRLYIDNKLVINDWTEGGERFTPEYTYSNLTAGKYVNITIETHTSGSSSSTGRIMAVFKQRLASAPTYNGTDLYKTLTPAYNLSTSSIAYDSTLGNTVSTTQYSNAAYGTVSSTTLDPSGLNYISRASYETPGSGFLRQTNKTLPGGAGTTYRYYGQSDSVTVGATTYSDKGGYAIDPCSTSPTYGRAISQGGQIKGKTDIGGRSISTIYNARGDVLATRYNSDAWTCTNYDNRGRITVATFPSNSTTSARTLTNNYAETSGGIANPLITSATDNSGTITVESDLLGKTVKYTDAKGNITTNTYDDFGKIVSRTSPVGNETYAYDQFDRIITQKLDGVTFATVTYDTYSQVQNVQYQAGISLQPAVRDVFGQVSRVTYGVNGQSIIDQVVRSPSGQIISGTQNGVSKSYTYDKADRLINAIIGANTLNYTFGAPDSSCSSLPGNNINTAKDGNRTSYTLNGQTTTYCYNISDQLIESSDARFTNPTYDSHGNTASLGDTTHKTSFTYDSVDRNMSINETSQTGTKEAEYQRDVTDRIIHRNYKVNGSTIDDSYNGFTGSGNTPDFVKDGSGVIKQKYLNLIGGVRVTIKPQSQSAGAVTYSLPNIHGDIMATVNADGTPTVIDPSGPFGENLPSRNVPANSIPGLTTDYLGANGISSESDFMIRPVQMGARVYIPELGRFLQADPIEGGSVNNYTYALDPINQKDVNGKWVIAVFLAVVTVVSIVIAVHSIIVAIKNPTPTNIAIAAFDTAGAATAAVTGGGSVVAARVASAGLETGARAASTASKTAVLQANRQAGKEAEAIAMQQAKAKYAKDYELRAQQYIKVNGFNRGRYADIAAYRNDQLQFTIEVKSGNARYGGLQAEKDRAIFEQYGAPTTLQRIQLTGK